MHPLPIGYHLGLRPLPLVNCWRYHRTLRSLFLARYHCSLRSLPLVTRWRHHCAWRPHPLVTH